MSGDNLTSIMILVNGVPVLKYPRIAHTMEPGGWLEIYLSAEEREAIVAAAVPGADLRIRLEAT